MRDLNALSRASASASTTGQVWLYLVEIDHQELPVPIRIVNDHQDYFLCEEAPVKGGVFTCFGRDNYHHTYGYYGGWPEGLSGALMVATAWDHGMVLLRDGSIQTWGLNQLGQRDIPEPNSGYIYIACGRGSLSYGIRTDRTLEVWAGTGSAYGGPPVPSPNEEWVQAAGGDRFTIGRKSNGSLVFWGDTSDGKDLIPTPNEYIDVAAGRDHLYALRANGTIEAWGDNYHGQCNVPSPNSDFVKLGRGGEWHSAAIKSDGRAICWGDNRANQCDVPTPNADFVEVACGGFYTVGIKSTGEMIPWGDENWDGSSEGWVPSPNGYGNLEVPHPNHGFWRCDAGGFQTLAIRGTQYTAYPFDLTLPDENNNASVMSMQMTFGNADRMLIPALRSISSVPAVTIRIVLASDPHHVVAGPWRLEWQAAEYDAGMIRASLGYEPILSRKYPADGFTPDLFPGLF